MNTEMKESKQNAKETGGKSVLSRVAKYVTAAAVLLVLFWFGFTCQIREGECGVILRFGAVRKEVTDAGLYMKLPWPFESVVKYDARKQYLESNKLETTTKDKRNVILQSFVVWSVADPVVYHNSVGTQGSVESYIKDQVFSATNSTLGAYNLTALVSLEKEEIRFNEIQTEIFNRVKEKCEANYGIVINDVSILRLSLPDTNLESVFEQMRADRQKDIDIILANAYKESNRITSEADSEASRINGEGVTEAAAIKAETEKAVARIYAEAQTANIELYKFLKNLDAVVASVNSSTILVIKTTDPPFNVLKEYADSLDIEGDQTVVKDLSYILSKLNETDRQNLITAVETLIRDAAAAGGITMP
mgnify:FL=1